MTGPVGDPVGDPTGSHEEWRALAAELAPAKSLQRLDTAATRVVSTVSIVATLLTGLGLVAAGLTNLTPLARGLAITAAVAAFLAVLLALTTQTLAVIRGLNRDNLVEVEDWYLTRFENRAPRLRWATYLLVAAAALAAASAVTTLLSNHEAPTLAITRTNLRVPGKLTVDITFRGLDPGQVATALVRIDNTLVAEAAFGPGPDGTASRTLTVEQVSASGAVAVEAHGGPAICTASAKPGAVTEVHCPVG